MTVSVFIGTSLDGFIARPNDDLDFLPEGGGEPHGYDEFMATVDALVIGRKTFEKVLTFGAWPYGDKRVVVLSSRPVDLTAGGRGVVEQMAGSPAEIVSQLAASDANHLYVDGGITIQEFLRAGLIQRLIITRVPVLIGAGVPLFGSLPRDIQLRHVATRHYPSGLVQSEYLVGADKIMTDGQTVSVLMALSGDTGGVQIRDAQLEDREFILGLVPQLLDFGPPPAWRDAHRMTEVDGQVIGEAAAGASPGASVLIAEDESGRRLGFIHLCEEHDYYGGACGHVGDVVVAPEARGQGVGRALLKAAEHWARAQGFRLLTLNVFMGNERARALYEELGFFPETVRLVKDLG